MKKLFLALAALLSFSIAVAQPANDQCSGATALTSGTSVAGTMAGATVTNDPFPSCPAISEVQPVWYSYTTGASPGTLTVTVTHGTSRWTCLTAYRGPCGSTMTEIACVDASTNTFNPQVVVDLCASTTYYFMVWNDAGTSGTFSILANFTAVAAPANDNCASATNITLNAGSTTGTYSGSATGTTVGACPDGNNSTCFDVDHNVWYTFTAPAAGSYYVQVAGGTIIFPEISILTGSCGSFTEQGCAGALNSTVTGTEHPYGFMSATSTVPYAYGGVCSASAGQVIYVMIDNYQVANAGALGGTGTFTVTVWTLANDDIGLATVLPSCGTTFASSTIGATNCSNCLGDNYYNDLDCSTSACSGSSVASGGGGNGITGCNGAAGSYANANCTNGGDVGYSVENDSWYQFCVTATSTVTVTFAPVTSSCLPSGTSGLQIALFTGTGSPPTLTKVGGGYCGQDITGSSTFTYTMAASVCSYIEVDGFAGTNCDYNLTVSMTPGCNLPVELLSFKGDNLGANQVKLDWTLASEKDIYYYTIERSADGIDFSEILRVNSRGSSNVKTAYEAYDRNALKGSNFYRLVGYDKYLQREVLSQTLVTNKSTLPSFSVFPNPSSGKLNINLANFSSETVNVQVFDMYGKTVYSAAIDLDNGGALQQLDLSTFSAGVYFVKASDGENMYKQSIIITQSN